MLSLTSIKCVDLGHDRKNNGEKIKNNKIF